MRRRPTWTLTQKQRRLWNVGAFLLIITVVITPGGSMTALALVIAIAIVKNLFIRPSD